MQPMSSAVKRMFDVIPSVRPPSFLRSIWHLHTPPRLRETTLRVKGSSARDGQAHVIPVPATVAALLHRRDTVKSHRVTPTTSYRTLVQRVA
jgi:hypothetical protein